MIFKEVKQDRFDRDKRYRGRSKGYVVELIFNDHSNSWYFMIKHSRIDFVLNSLWELPEFQSYDECEDAAQKRLGLLVNNK